ncbi:hypothetical protein C5167_029956, partial [Papaver somniferum]
SGIPWISKGKSNLKSKQHNIKNPKGKIFISTSQLASIIQELPAPNKLKIKQVREIEKMLKRVELSSENVGDLGVFSLEDEPMVIHI